MSYYESPEQRQIRELRNKVKKQATENNALRRDIENVRRQQRDENERIAQQMRRQQNEFNQERAAMSSAIQSLDREVRERERLQNAKIAAMHEQHNQQINRLNSQFRQETDSLRGDLQRTQTEMRNQLSEMRIETEQKLREQKNELQRTIEAVGVELDEKITSVDIKVQSLMEQMAERENNSRELAEYWVQEAERLVRNLKETYRESLFDERRIRRIEQDLRDAHQDIETGHYDSAIKTGRDAFRDSMEMREDLAVLDLEWNYRYNLLRNRESSMLENLDSAEHRIYSIDTDDGVVEYDNGIDYWTNGQLSIVKERIQKLRDRMGDLQNSTVDELIEYEREANSLLEELMLVENAAHINVAMSLSRYQTAVKIGEILGEEFEMIDSDGDFYREENREEYHAIYANPVTGDRVVVVITPMPDEAGVVTNHIELIAGNAMDNDIVNRGTIHNVVSTKLQESGIQDIRLERCASRHGDNVEQVINRAGDIAAVAAGDEKVRVGVPGQTTRDDAVARVHRGTTN